MELWIVGQLTGEWSPTGSVWEFQGVFSSEVKAVAACRDKNYFLFPTSLDTEIPHETEYAPNARYPLADWMSER